MLKIAILLIEPLVKVTQKINQSLEDIYKTLINKQISKINGKDYGK